MSGPKGRLLSLDALRGADMLMLTGFSALVIKACEAAGAKGCWLARQFEHAPWHGMTFEDTIFPLFLFLSGVSWSFSCAKSRAKGLPTPRIVGKVLVRSFWLIVLGFAYAPLFQFDFANVYWDSVLTHIGICWGAAALVTLFVQDNRRRLVLAAVTLVGYWLLLKFCLALDRAALLASTDPQVVAKVAEYAGFGTDGFSFTGNLAGWVDRLLVPGRFYEGCFHADGLLTKVTGTVSVLLGVWAGDLLRRTDLDACRRLRLLVGAGIACAVLCAVWMPWCPVNKKIWTPTFVLAAGAYSFLMLALFHWMIDVRGWVRWSFFFRVIGVNALTVYVMRRFVNFHFTSKFFLGGVAGLLPGSWGEVLIWAGYIASWWLVLLFLYRKNVFVKL